LKIFNSDVTRVHEQIQDYTKKIELEIKRGIEKLERAKLIPNKDVPFLERYRAFKESTVPTIKYDGIKRDLPMQDLIKGGWKIILQKSYANCTQNQEILDFGQLNYTQFCVGGREITSDLLKLCAFGDKNIFSETFSKETPVMRDGVYWYCVKDNSFGFSDQSNVSLNQADGITGDLRLSWHLTGKDGGYRIGELVKDNTNGNYEKIVLGFK